MSAPRPTRKLILIAPAALLLTLCLLLTWRGPVLAHGVDANASIGQAVVVIAMYDDGEPMSFAKVKVLDPAGETYQLGNSDAGGCFAFVPGQPGNWNITFSDGMGHRAVTVWQQKQPDKAASGSSPATPPSSSSGQPKDAPKWVRVTWGLSALFWLSGLLFWWKGAKKKGQQKAS